MIKKITTALYVLIIVLISPINIFMEVGGLA